MQCTVPYNFFLQDKQKVFTLQGSFFPFLVIPVFQKSPLPWTCLPLIIFVNDLTNLFVVHKSDLSGLYEYNRSGWDWGIPFLFFYRNNSKTQIPPISFNRGFRIFKAFLICFFTVSGEICNRSAISLWDRSSLRLSSKISRILGGKRSISCCTLFRSSSLSNNSSVILHGLSAY